MIQHDDDKMKQVLLYKSINDCILDNNDLDGENIEYLFFYKILFIKNKKLLIKQENLVKSLNNLNYKIISLQMI